MKFFLSGPPKEVNENGLCSFKYFCKFLKKKFRKKFKKKEAPTTHLWFTAKIKYLFTLRDNVTSLLAFVGYSTVQDFFFSSWLWFTRSTDASRTPLPQDNFLEKSNELHSVNNDLLFHIFQPSRHLKISSSFRSNRKQKIKNSKKQRLNN